MSTATASKASTEKEKEQEKKKPPRDPAREVIETVVFVVVLVLLLKLFDTEAFVIPTGSMAETLYGYQKIIHCPECGHQFPVNSHDEVEGPDAPNGRKDPKALEYYVCPNCRYHGVIRDPAEWSNRTGDRVLVLKALYHLRDPQRGDVVVFKYPRAPQKDHIASNYIKRAMGFGGETIAIHRGDLYVTMSLDYSDPNIFRRPASPLDLWQHDYMYPNSGQAEKLFEASRNAGFPAGPIKNLPPDLKKHFEPLLAEGFSDEKSGFVIIRKEEKHLLADLRIVWDNDKQPKYLQGVVPSRWHDPAPNAGRWKPDSPDQPRAFTHTGPADSRDPDWIRYRHYSQQWKTAAPTPTDPMPRTRLEDLKSDPPLPRFVDNFLGYNASRPTSSAESLWVGDLVLECEVDIPGGSEVILELSKGANRFQATFGKGQVSLSHEGPLAAKFKPEPRPCKVNAGVYKLRFGNVDNRLWVWVDGKRIDFGAEAEYSPVAPDKFDQNDPNKEGWLQANDIDKPASIGAKGPVSAVRSIKLQRDIYYTWGQGRGGADYTMADIYYVQPGHYMCLGDNSSHSSDSREWGTVPERLMLGKAVFVFWPGYPPPSRIGFIK